MAKILLIQPHQDIRNKVKLASHIPLSLLYLATAIKSKHEVKIFDRNLYPNDIDMINILKEYSPNIIGFNSMTSPMLLDIIHMGPLIKSILNNVLIIAGGVHATVEPDSFLNEPWIDYVIRGEGELAFLEFCNIFDKNKKNLKNLKNVNKNPIRPLANLNNLENPDWNLIDLKKYSQVWISTSRGCPGNCSFCYNVKMWGQNGIPCVRFLNTENTIKLFKSIIEDQGITEFSIADDNFVTFKQRCIEVCNFLAEKYGGKISFLLSARADKIDDEILSALKKAGCNSIQFGSESGSQRMLDILNKQMTVEVQGRAISLCHKHKIFNYDSFMIGLPGEKISDLNLTKKFIRKYKPDVVVGFAFNPMPGTFIFEELVKKGIIVKPKTLKEWASYNDGSWRVVKHNSSEIPNKVIIKTLESFWKFRFYKTKIKKFFWWIKKGKFEYIFSKIKSMIKEKSFSSNF